LLDRYDREEEQNESGGKSHTERFGDQDVVHFGQQ